MTNQGPTNYVLIDFENIQPKNLGILKNHPFKVFVFVGDNHSKVPFDFAAAMQDLGEDAKYIKISGNGPNALDFHIAFYLGQLSLKDPTGYYHIISKDKGFDPLINHLKERKVRVQREADLAEIPILRVSNAASHEDKIEAILKNLASRGQSKPRKVKTLANTINSLLTKKLNDSELMSLINELKKRGVIVVNQESVSYRLTSRS